MGKEAVHLQSKEARVKVINQFCRIITVFSFLFTLIYLYLNIHVLSFLCGTVSALFLIFIFLNKKGFYKISSAAIIVTTNLGVIAFSLILGFNSGIYMYLFAAPLITYLLYDFQETKTLIAVFICYVLTFFVVYYFNEERFPPIYVLSDKMLTVVNIYNMCAAFVLSFGIITYFVSNNERYIRRLKEQQATLKEEVQLRIESESQLKKSLRDREILLSEIHHRVKNNLAVISALLNLQVDRVKDFSVNDIKAVFRETSNRIFAMSLIHNLLYQNKSLANIDLEKFIHSLCLNIEKSYPRKEKIEIKIIISDSCSVNLHTAVPLALILNELITNSFKHAFDLDERGTIRIELQPTKKNHYLFTISDNGKGMEVADLTKDSIGMTIVHSLVEQIEGTLTYEKKDGSRFGIEFEGKIDD